MRILIVTFFLSLFCLNLHAQYYEISLEDYELKQPIRNIKIQQIIDLRPDQTNIGWVQTGLGNKKMVADLDDNFTDALNRFILSNTRISGEPIPVILKVNKFQISELTENSREHAYADIALEFLAKKDSGYISLAQTTSFVQASSGLDVTDKHEDNIVKALEACFDKLTAIDIFEKFKTSETLSADYLLVNSNYELNRFNFPILKDQHFRKGLYNSFTEFLNNAPGSTAEPKLSLEEAVRLLKLGNSLDGIWGFSDGETAYYLSQDRYFPLTRKADYFTFKAFVPKVNTNAIVIGSVVGGLAGGLLAHALTPDSEEVAFAVNMVTGKPVRLENYNPQRDIAKGAKIIFYRGSKNQNPAKLDLYVNDSLHARISLSTIQELNFSYPVSEVKICLNGPDQHCLKITPSVGTTTYLAGSLKKKAGSKPEITEVAENEALYYMKLIKKFQGSSRK